MNFIKYKKCIPTFQTIGYKRMMQPAQGMFLGITPVSSVSNGLYFLTLPLVSVMRVIYTSKGMSKKFGFARYLSKNTVTQLSAKQFGQPSCKHVKLLFAVHVI